MLDLSKFFRTAVFIVDLLMVHTSFNHFGLLPRTIPGLTGIFLCPFLHADLPHIISNSVPLFVLSMITAIYFKKDSYLIVGLIIVLGGLMVWVFGRPFF